MPGAKICSFANIYPNLIRVQVCCHRHLDFSYHHSTGNLQKHLKNKQ